MDILADKLEHPAVIALLQEHLDDMAKHSPPESVHALDLSGLKKASVTFLSAWDGDTLLGCGALQELDAAHGEIKSMRTAKAHLGCGVASTLLSHIIDSAKQRGLERLSLETGSGPEFEAAHQLYSKFGFTECQPFGGYTLDPYSRFMTLQL